MKKPLNYFALIIFLSLFQLQGIGQSTECATDAIHHKLMSSDSVYRQQIHLLESQVAVNIQSQVTSKSKSTIYTIPVVVHVLHLGESIGTGSNISDSQIQQAITGLNSRFRNVNGLGADVEMEFCLASKDPNGNSTE